MTESESKEMSAAPAPAVRSLAEFLEAAPVLTREAVAIECSFEKGQMRPFRVTLPIVRLYCGSKDCCRIGIFDSEQNVWSLGEMIGEEFVYYRCRQCRRTRKLYVLRIELRRDSLTDATFTKIGEEPPAIGPTPRALQDLLGDNWELYLKGRRAELAGLGIGAFVYYRRVIEHVWFTVLDELIKVAQLDPSPARTLQLQEAKAERQFTRSMESAKSAIPISLYVEGHNPFQALYDACGDGLHEFTDEECIRRAHVIRLVLTRFSERAKSVLSEDAEFRHAVGVLINTDPGGAAGQDYSPSAGPDPGA